MADRAKTAARRAVAGEGVVKDDGGGCDQVCAPPLYPPPRGGGGGGPARSAVSLHLRTNWYIDFFREKKK